MRWCLPAFLTCAALAMLGECAPADERLAGIACRSVHLSYTAPVPDGVAFYNEVKVEKSAPGTYFCVCGWNKGYFGIQEQGGGKKVVIFSVWDSSQNDPKAVNEDKRVKLLHKDEKVRIGRFGGEGTGGQSFLDFDWKVAETYRFLITAKVNGERTEYSGFFAAPDEKGWRHLVTFSTITGGKKLGGYYSFVEDFKRDKVSTTKARQAIYGNAWVMTDDGKWHPITKARFTADSNPATNIDAGLSGERFFLATGGDTKNAGVKLNGPIELPRDAKRFAPQGLPKIP